MWWCLEPGEQLDEKKFWEWALNDTVTHEGTRYTISKVNLANGVAAIQEWDYSDGVFTLISQRGLATLPVVP